MLKLRTLFSGIGSPEIALRDLGIDYEVMDFCEIDKYAAKSYSAVHGVSESKNLGDITKVWGRNLPYADMLVWGFPCQDISVAGKQRGIQEGATRSGLYYEGFRILKETKPKYSIIENVKNLVGKKFKEDFESMLEDIESIGYNNYWKVLNAKDYGIPQNRERVFIVSIRKDVDTGKFAFPEGFDNGLRLKDFLENEVDEKYYISQEKTEKLIDQLKDKNQDMCYCIDANYYKGTTPEQFLKKSRRQLVAIPCLTPDRVEKRQNGRRFKEDGDPMFTLTSQDRHGILQIGTLNGHQSGHVYSTEGLSVNLCANGGGMGAKTGLYATLTSDYRIRKLTPKECWRLMGFQDTDFEKAAEVNSNSQLYKQAGNSIVSNVLYHIFDSLLIKSEMGIEKPKEEAM